MYERKKFDEREAEYSVLLRRKLEEAEAMLLKLNPSRERSLALTKLDETLLWANAAIAAAGISTDREGKRSIGSCLTVVSDDVCTGHEKKESSIDIPEEIRPKMSLDISAMISDAIDNKALAFGSKR